MKKLLQFNDSAIPMLVIAETIPIHPNQYEVAPETDFDAINGKAYDFETGTFYEPLPVPDFTKPVANVPLLEKVSS